MKIDKAPGCILFPLTGPEEDKTKFIQVNTWPFIWFRVWHFKSDRPEDVKFHLAEWEKNKTPFVQIPDYSIYLTYELHLAGTSEKLSYDELRLAFFEAQEFYYDNQIKNSKFYERKYKTGSQG